MCAMGKWVQNDRKIPLKWPPVFPAVITSYLQNQEKNLLYKKTPPERTGSLTSRRYGKVSSLPGSLAEEIRALSDTEYSHLRLKTFNCYNKKLRAPIPGFQTLARSESPSSPHTYTIRCKEERIFSAIV